MNETGAAQNRLRSSSQRPGKKQRGDGDYLYENRENDRLNKFPGFGNKTGSGTRLNEGGSSTLTGVCRSELFQKTMNDEPDGSETPCRGLNRHRVGLAILDVGKMWKVLPYYLHCPNN